jgi:dCMP deaminase
MENEIEKRKRLEQRSLHKIDTFAKIVEEISHLSNASTKKVACMTLHRNFTKIASFGYNGSYAGAPINPITGTEEDSLEPGESGFIHAEVNMIAKFRENDPENYIVLLTLSPCKMCTKILVNSGFKWVYWLEDYREKDHLSIFDECGIKYGNINKLKQIYESEIK